MAADLKNNAFRFEVAFSFAGPHRDKVRAIAEILRNKLGDGKVFFDEWFEDELSGDDADAQLQRIYGAQSLMVVADVSEAYSGRPWCQAEARAVRALRMALDTAGDPTQRKRLAYIRFDDAEVAGVLRNAITWDGQSKNAEQLADLILSRLRKLREALGIASPVIVARETCPPPILLFHPATNDERYSRRKKELAWLDDCARDSSIRIATVTGQGGLGKTSLVGHWIEKHRGWQHRPFRGAFFYSFYSNRDPKTFFEAFLEFIHNTESISVLPKDIPIHHLAATVLGCWRAYETGISAAPHCAAGACSVRNR